MQKVKAEFFLVILLKIFLYIIYIFPLPIPQLSAFFKEEMNSLHTTSMKARVQEVYLLPTHQNGFSSVVSQLPYTYLNIFLLYVTNKQIFSLLELKIKLMYWQISTAASQVFILKIIIFNSSWLISLKLKLVLWQLGIISQMPAQRRAQTRRM